MKMTEAEKEEAGSQRGEVAWSAAGARTRRTYDGEDERVGEVSVERQLHHVPPQLQQLHGLSQTHKDVRTRSRNMPEKTVCVSDQRDGKQRPTRLSVTTEASRNNSPEHRKDRRKLSAALQ